MLNVSLEDKYLVSEGRVFVNGTQVLVKLPLIQKTLDEKKKLIVEKGDYVRDDEIVQENEDRWNK